MESLYNVIEGLLDSDLEDQLGKEIIPKPIEWLLQKFDPIKFRIDSSNEYSKCYVNAEDYKKCREQLEDIIFDFRLKGTSKYKITRKQYWELFRQQSDTTIICFTGEQHKETCMGIGNFARRGAIQIQLDGRGPMKAHWNQQYDMVVIKDPSLWSSFSGREPEINGTLMPGWADGKTKQRYYAFPGHCWEQIKQSLIR